MAEAGGAKPVETGSGSSAIRFTTAEAVAYYQEPAASAFAAATA